MTRKMASIRRIDAINPIPGADAIEVATVGGWKVVVKKGEFFPGELAVYCEIDSWIPTEIAPFLSKGKDPREHNGVKGERLRTVTLRGQLSQGLLIRVSTVDNAALRVGEIEFPCVEGLDVSDRLNIQKWEPVIPAQLAGMVKGPFPSEVPKTDQERIQNLVTEIGEAHAKGRVYEVTEKLEGSSCTMYLDLEGEFHVCSRNLNLMRDENNSLWKVAIKYNVEEALRSANLKGFAIQGELVGPGVQGNIYKLRDVDFFVYDIYDVTAGDYVLPDARQAIVKDLGLKHVPVMATNKDLGTGEVDYILSWADGKSVLGDIVGPLREGLVFKDMDGGMSFKAISNMYLIGEK